MSRHVSPYLVPGFYETALTRGRHRDIIGGRWDETGRIQMDMLLRLGLQPQHKVLDIGCGPLRTGCRLVPFLDPGNYWGTDLSGALMATGYRQELTDADRARLPECQLVEDGTFDFPGLPRAFDIVLCFAVFTHLPRAQLAHGLARVAERLEFGLFAFTVFLAPDAAAAARPYRQPDGVVTHGDRTPWHVLAEDVTRLAADVGLKIDFRDDRLPRGQVLCVAQR
ncbi:MAG: class I SAM-dependent methyltransferase [Rhodobacterales bacterium]|nr:class I SAM-dependent methyltransferase [Rhodobacterales bacterium]MDX5501074.1 class I SAM-dependent methyltransferase [Rhodobacterales bacterium]